MTRTTSTSIILAIVVLINLSIVVLGIQLHQQPNILFPVLFESPRILVVRKPHDIGHHDELTSQSLIVEDEEQIDNDNDSLTPGVLRLLRHQRKCQAEDEGERLYGVHRLDKVTSGILVLAKDASTASTLSDFFAQGKIQKVYFGLSAKKPQKKKQGLVQGGMTRSRNKSWKLVRNQKDGKNNGRLENFAKTRFFTTGMQGAGGPDASGVNPMTNVKTVAMFRPYTGRTHQLRVAAKAMGIPLLGDPIYKDGGDKGSNIEVETTRTMLHASGIHIPGFQDQPEINVWCPPTFFEDDEGEDLGINEKRTSLTESLDVAVEKLMTKNCDVPGILEAMTLKGQE